MHGHQLLTVHIPQDAIPAEIDDAVKTALQIEDVGSVIGLNGKYSYMNIEVQGQEAVHIETGKRIRLADLQEQIREKCGFLRESEFLLSDDHSNLRRTKE
jgi:hypothetical protein